MHEAFDRMRFVRKMRNLRALEGLGRRAVRAEPDREDRLVIAPVLLPRDADDGLRGLRR